MSFLADSSRGRLLSHHCLNRVLSMLSSTKDGRVRFGRYKPIYLSPDKIDYVCDWERRQTKHEAPPRLHPRSLPHSCASSSPPQFASAAPSFLRKRVTYRVNEAKRAREEEGEVRAKSGRGASEQAGRNVSALWNESATPPPSSPSLCPTPPPPRRPPWPRALER